MSENDGKAAEKPRFEINTNTDESHSASFEPGGEVALSTAKESVGVSFNADGTTSRTDLVDEAELEAEVDASLKDEQEGEGEETTPEDTPEAEGEELAELPAFDADNEEVMAAYKERYITESGELNFNAFNDSFYKSMAENPDKPDITPDQRAFVKKHMGVSDAAIDTYLGGVAQKSKELDAALFAEFGGEANYTAAMDWAKAGYTQAQKDKFNAALKSGNAEDLKDQLDLLKARHSAAAPKPKQQEQAATKERRPSSPKASSTEATAGNATSVEPYGSLSEYQRDMAAYGAKNDIKGMRDAEKRLAASKKLWKPGAK